MKKMQKNFVKISVEIKLLNLTELNSLRMQEQKELTEFINTIKLTPNLSSKLNLDLDDKLSKQKIDKYNDL